MATKSTGAFPFIALELQELCELLDFLAEPPQEDAQRSAFGLADSRHESVLLLVRLPERSHSGV